MLVGATLKIGTPRNNFPLREDAAHTVLFAGGIGITPIWCMVQRLVELGRDWRLYYSCRSRADMAFLKRARRHAEATLHFDDESAGRFSTSPVSSPARPPRRISIAAGRRRCWRRSRPRPRTGRATTSMSSISRPSRTPAKTGGFTVELARSGGEYFIPEGETILNVLLDAGIDIDYSCELGICGACEQRVISGIPSTATPSSARRSRPRTSG